MKKILMSFVLVTLLLGFGQALAQEDNLLGLYFDPFGNLDCMEAATIPPFSFVDLYIVLKNPTFEVLSGFEAGFDIEGPAILDEWAFPEGVSGINVGSPGEFIIGYSTGIPMEETNHLLTLKIFYMSVDNEEVCFRLSAIQNSSLDPLYPTFAYPVGDDYEMVSANVNNGIDGACTARISATPCYVVSTENQTWDSLKSLYR